MAWRSSGTTNDEMVNNLKRFGVISSLAVEQGFRNVDRRYFVPKNRQDVAHTDQPLKEGNVHISAPHIYGSALEALELAGNSSLSFLNVGSGTGYLSSIVADVLGPRSSNYGIEIHADVVDHSKQAVERWRQSRAGVKTAPIEFIHGNALRIDSTHGECLVGFDRIYVGASVERSQLNTLTALLRPGGILVGPVDDELVKVVRIGSSDSEDKDFTQQVLSGVRFAPLIQQPALPTRIPSRVWNPSIHHYYPDSFRTSCKELLLCSNASKVQPEHQKRLNLASMLPRVLWMEILSYTHRDWFEPPQSEVSFLRRRLLEEQANAQRAHQARLEAETRCHIAERERDVYRLLARRWQAQAQLNRDGGNGNNNNDDIVLSGREQAVILGLGAMFRDFEEDVEEILEPNNAMDEDGEEEEGVAMIMADEGDESDDTSIEEATGIASAVANGTNASMDEDEIADPPKALEVRAQVRTVSVTDEDL